MDAPSYEQTLEEHNKVEMDAPSYVQTTNV